MIELLNRARLDPLGEAARFGVALNSGLPAGSITSAPKAPLAFDWNLAEAAAGQPQGGALLATDREAAEEMRHAGRSAGRDCLHAAYSAFPGSGRHPASGGCPRRAICSRW